MAVGGIVVDIRQPGGMSATDLVIEIDIIAFLRKRSEKFYASITRCAAGAAVQTD